MDVQQIKGMGRPLKKFLSEFDDCFGRSEPREHLRTYVQGRLSNLPRKSIEPIALSAQVALEWLLWVAFSRWPIERYFEMAKSELGMDHFEMRSWRGIHRHLYLTVEQVRLAACAWVQAQAYPAGARIIIYERAVEQIRYHQRRNRQACLSHWKSTLRRLKTLGIDIHKLKSCVPSEL